MKKIDSSALVLPKHAKKYLLLLEDTKLLEQANLQDDLADKKIETQIYVNTEYITDEEKNSIRTFYHPFSLNHVIDLLNQQLVGTHLFIAGKTRFIQELKELAYLGGFAEEEIHSFVLGPIEEKVFCVKCYISNIKQQHEVEMTCKHCHTPLQISNHYSKRLNAYLGYIRVG